MALDKGAQAVIFDVSDDADAAAEVSVKGWSEAPLQPRNEQKHHIHARLWVSSCSEPDPAAGDGLPPPARRLGGVR